MQVKLNGSALAVMALIPILCLPAIAKAQDAYDIVNLGSLGGYTLPEAINNEGQITGYSRTQKGIAHAFYYNVNSGQMQDITPNSSTYTEGKGINDLWQVTVNAYSNFQVYNINTQTTRILNFNGNNISEFDGINNNGDGVIDDFDRTILYHYSTNTFEILTNPPQMEATMRAINNNGELAGTINQVAAYYKNGAFQKIGAIPRASTVPEPGSLLTFTVGASVMFLAARRRARLSLSLRNRGPG